MKICIRRFRLYGIACLLMTSMLLSIITPLSAADPVTKAADRAAAYMLDTVPSPACAQVGGDWMMFGLARAGVNIPTATKNAYLQNVKNLLIEKNGVLTKNKLTEYSRLALAVTALGYNARNMYGYDLLTPLTNLTNTTKQGVNGAIFALLAFDAGGYALNYASVTRQDFISYILNAQRKNGSWALTATGDADADITATAILALHPYRGQTAVTNAINRGLAALSSMQTSDGGYAYRGDCSAECTAQVLCMMSALKIPVTDPRFVKNGNTVLDHLLSFALSDGSFSHIHGGKTDGIATEQAFYALTAYRRMQNGENTLYCMTDRTWIGGVHPDVSSCSVIAPGKTFPDLKNSTAQTAVQALAARGIINGCDDGQFHPEQNLTRAQFAQILSGALSLPMEAVTIFPDVKESDWFYPAVATAARVGLILGTASGTYEPNRPITRQEAALILSRAAALCGIFPDQTAALHAADAAQVADWAYDAAAFCVKRGYLTKTNNRITPTTAITRGDTANAVYALMRDAGLLP
ncbi:MAG: hypothetical protein E7604_08295 [Ruminococcaceae bacterium]|nr:hypothetical protein [Oscillospiraceae bacterium]